MFDAVDSYRINRLAYNHLQRSINFKTDHVR
jgi:hypothetical protein